MSELDRRQLLAAGAAFSALGFGAIWSRSAHAAAFGAAEPFSFDLLRARARRLAGEDYRPPEKPAPDATAAIDYDTVQKIRYRADRALWQDAPVGYPVRFFHLHRFAQEPVRMNVVSGEQSRPLVYEKALFDYGDTGLGESLPEGLGFAGFRVMDGSGRDSDWLAFQGASYFRTSGESDQYGISARGIATNTALATREEFPVFTEFWLQAPLEEGAPLVIYALLEGPSVTGAYRFDAAQKDGAVMDVHAELFMRGDVPRLGIAPLTSMYWFGENERRQAVDWRPEIHDSDGLALWTGTGERIFRPLVNPPSVQVNSFVDRNPKGFGLMQRDRDFDHYQDDGAFYDRRPSVWVEPKGDWGDGAVVLVEIPTDDEVYDNIVAFWQPKKPVRDGDVLAFDYRLHWRDREPYPAQGVGQVVATRIGRGGIPGGPASERQGLRKFVVDFAGGPLTEMEARYDVDPVVTVSHGEVSNGYVIKVVGTNSWRAVFDVAVDGDAPIDLRCFLRLDGRTLTETWLYKYFPKT
ncbi:glucan biosynthesis protein [Oceanibacterium hippocampi]|uniref:Glucans biosynthesis protein D n=1 Tax=Oceanibacterium hippocampi TaxID=745714 RepID=A0A1Y5TFC8_9PROT|nr:glucan biosynthesis protein [Oceanibacterium hippocampi]SLN62745.1 Glucans biosynthesis protein D precursor [Oceanibacterium hippocampi]